MSAHSLTVLLALDPAKGRFVLLATDTSVHRAIGGGGEDASWLRLSDAFACDRLDLADHIEAVFFLSGHGIEYGIL